MGGTVSICGGGGENKNKNNNRDNEKLKGKVIMKLEHARRLNRSGIVELEKLSGHPNYIARLADWAAVDRLPSDKVYVFSYRHLNGLFASTDGGNLGDRYLSGNYEWALDYLEKNEEKMKLEEGTVATTATSRALCNTTKTESHVAIGWLDILCTCHDEETLMDAFGYMGDLYLNNKVANNYMSTPKAFSEVQTRGWIYQESAFPAIDIEACGWDDEAWNDISYYRIVADLILRRGFQGLVKTKALDVMECKKQFDEIVKRGKGGSISTISALSDKETKWWSDVENYIDMICDPDGLGIVLDLHGLYKLSLLVPSELKNVTDASVIDIGTELQELTQSCYEAVVSELKSSLAIQAQPSHLGYFAVGAIKAFLSSELAVESDRNAAIFGVLKVLSNFQQEKDQEEDHQQDNDNDDTKEMNDVDSILQFIWTLAYPKGEIIASPVRVHSSSHCLAGLGTVEAMESDSSITPHIPHLRTFVPELNERTRSSDGAKLYIGKTSIRINQSSVCVSDNDDDDSSNNNNNKNSNDFEFCVEIYADKERNVRALRIIPKSYWNYNEVAERVRVLQLETTKNTATGGKNKKKMHHLFG